jgi:hypothetical protein
MTFAAAALMIGLVASAADKEPWIVLVRSDGSMPTSWRPLIQDAARKAASTSDKVQWQEPPAVSLEEAELALGCKGWGPACAGQIAGMMNAGAALVVDFAADGAGATVKLAVVGTNGEARPGTAREAKLADRGAGGLAIVQASVVGMIRGSAPTIVVVDSDLPGVEVAIDGVKSGKTPLTLVDELSPGEHQLVLSKEGRAPLTTTIDVEVGKANSYTFPLGGGGPDVVGPSIGDQPASATVMPVVAYATAGVGAALFVVAGGLGAGYGYTYAWRKGVADDAQQNGGVVSEPGLMKTYDAMDKASIPLAIGAITAAGVGAVLLGTGVALMFLPAE